jgi:hypothetical protein
LLKKTPLVCAALLGACVWTTGQPDAGTLERRRGFDWVADTTDHFILHFQRGGSAAARSDLLGFQLDRARERTLQVLNEQDFPDRIHVFAVESRARMDDLVGRPIDGIAFYRSKVITLVMGDSVSGSPAHEVSHVIAMNVWGVGPTWLNEGLGVHVAGNWRGRDVHAVARELRARGQLVTLDKLTQNFRSLDPRIAYPQAGSLVRFIRERYSPEALHALWLGDEAEFTRLAGIDLPAIDRLWMISLQGGRD